MLDPLFAAVLVFGSFLGLVAITAELVARYIPDQVWFPRWLTGGPSPSRRWRLSIELPLVAFGILMFGLVTAGVGLDPEQPGATRVVMLLGLLLVAAWTAFLISIALNARRHRK
jgi:hypothetical protein